MVECSVWRGVIEVESRSQYDIIDVTGMVEGAVASSGVKRGLVNVYVPHTTAGVIVNEAEPGLLEDILEMLRSLTRPGHEWRHNRVDNNAHAHLGQVLTGPAKTIPVEDGKLLLGTWQRILLVEMDGPRTRRIIVTVSGLA